MKQRLKQDFQIGGTIQALRIERYISQEQVTAKLQLYNINITRSIHSQIESGTYNICILAGLRQVFHVDYNKFFRNISLSDTDAGYLE